MSDDPFSKQRKSGEKNSVEERVRFQKLFTCLDY